MFNSPIAIALQNIRSRAQNENPYLAFAQNVQPVQMPINSKWYEILASSLATPLAQGLSQQMGNNEVNSEYQRVAQAIGNLPKGGPERYQQMYQIAPEAAIEMQAMEEQARAEQDALMQQLQLRDHFAQQQDARKHDYRMNEIGARNSASIEAARIRAGGDVSAAQAMAQMMSPNNENSAIDLGTLPPEVQQFGQTYNSMIKSGAPSKVAAALAMKVAPDAATKRISDQEASSQALEEVNNALNRSKDSLQIVEKAGNTGLPYQTSVASILGTLGFADQREKAANTQLLDAQGSQDVFENIPIGIGKLSESELKALQRTTVSSENLPDANRELIKNRQLKLNVTKDRIEFAQEGLKSGRFKNVDEAELYFEQKIRPRIEPMIRSRVYGSP
jgi:hypothetical protein